MNEIDPAIQALIDQIAQLSLERAGLIGRVNRLEKEAEAASQELPALRAELIRLQAEVTKVEGE